MRVKALQAVRRTAFEKGVQTRDFFKLRGNDELAADLVRNSVALAELDHASNSLHRQTSLGRTRLIVESTMQDSAVVPGLVAGGTAFLFENAD